MMFSKDFLFGASMSAFQAEAGCPEDTDKNNDWYVWLTYAENLVNGTVSGDTPETGANYWRNYDKVHQLAKDFGLQILRPSIDWSRIFTKPTYDVKLDYDNLEETLKKLDELADKNNVEHYREMFLNLKSKGLKLFLNLNHFTLPLWIHDPIAVRKGEKTEKLGWVSERTVEEFEKYALYIAWKFYDLVDMWSSMNEPHVVSQLGYLATYSGFPPAYFNIDWYFESLKNQAKATNRARKAVKTFSDKPYGVIYSFTWFDIEDGDKEIFEKAMWLNNYNFMDMVKDYVDFIGLNYYTRAVIRKVEPGFRYKDFVFNWTTVANYGYSCKELKVSAAGRPTSEMGWEIYPEGLYNMIKALYERYKKPIIITENGIGDHEDRYRPTFLIAHLRAVEKAIEEGCDVRGYFIWSLIDNLEWAKGYSKRFGFAYTDYKTKQYIPRPSMYVLKDIITERNLESFVRFDPYGIINF